MRKSNHERMMSMDFEHLADALPVAVSLLFVSNDCGQRLQLFYTSYIY